MFLSETSVVLSVKKNSFTEMHRGDTEVHGGKRCDCRLRIISVFLSETSVVLSVTKEFLSQSHAEETQRFTEERVVIVG